MKISYTWLQKYFDDPLPHVDELCTQITLHFAEIDSVEAVGGDWIIDVKILPDRACYALSHAGIAHEVAAIIRKPCARANAFGVDFDIATIENAVPPYPLRIDSPHCDYYTATKGTIGPIREGGVYDEIVRLLVSIGQRSINPLVDVANFVMQDIGQPLHIFDAGKVHGGITVRQAHEGEVLTTLDKKELTLTPEDMVIADDTHALALAGIKGGIKAESSRDTTQFILEAAHFDAGHVRRRSTIHGIKTDASKRYENAIAPFFAQSGASYALGLIERISTDVRIDAFRRVGEVGPTTRTCTITSRGISDMLGIELDLKTCTEYAVLLGFSISQDGDACHVTVPSWRHDIYREADIAEEIGRLYGYERIPSTLLSESKQEKEKNSYWRILEAIRSVLISRAFSEICTYTLVDHGEYDVLAAPAGRDALRTDISTRMKEALERNAQHADLYGLNRIALFEIGTVFTKHAGEEMHVCFGAIPVREKMKLTEAYVKEVCTELERMLEEFGIACAMTPALQTNGSVVIVEVSCSSIMRTADVEEREVEKLNVEIQPIRQYTHYSPYPYIVRDIAVFVPQGTDPDAITRSIKKHGGDLVYRHTLFDVFEKKDSGKTSYAYRIVFQSNERTLTDAEVEDIMNRIYADMHSLGYEVR